MRVRIGKSVLLIYITAIAAFLLTACSADIGQLSDRQSSAEGKYRIYYTNSDHTALVRHDYEPVSKEFEGILKEILDAFKTPPTSDLRSALPEQVVINSAASGGVNEINVDFNAEYLSLDTVTELLLRSALVKTLLGIQSVNSVRFTVDSQNLIIGDEEIGLMNEDTFIVPDGKGINSYRNTQMTLYFPAGDGTTLVSEIHSDRRSSNINPERQVIEEMLKGPNGEGLLPVAVDGALVQDAIVSNGYCIVDFNEDINNSPPGDVIANPETVLYAFTNSIIDSCRDDDIVGVRFRIGGTSDIRFRDQVNLDQIFSRNADIISAPAE